ncbi:MAG: hypothetical protein HC848_00180 [Limnobacter sp.]|nr:hypothetical protein [Limnobacter sp.]
MKNSELENTEDHATDHLFALDMPTFFPQDYDNGKRQWEIQSWFERMPWRKLKDTYYGKPKHIAPTHPALFEDQLLKQIYLMDIALFIGAEQTSYKAVAGMIGFAPDELSAMHLGTQVLDECRHYEVFCRRMADMGVKPEKRDALVKRYTSPAMRKFYDLIHEQVDKKIFTQPRLRKT